MVVPNVMAYATHSADVGIYDPARHLLDLDSSSRTHRADNLAVVVRHAEAVRKLDPEAVWELDQRGQLLLPPSGSSLVHPHLQSAHDPCGLTVQRLLG